MTELLDFVRRLGEDAGPAAFGLGNPAAGHRAAVGGLVGGGRLATLVGRAASPGLDARRLSARW